MKLEENIKAILECNFAIAREEVIEATTQRIMEQISMQNPLEEIPNPCIECSQNCCVCELNGEKCECQKVYVVKESKE